MGRGLLVGVAEEHEICASAFGSHLFYDLFLQGWKGGGGCMALSPHPNPLLQSIIPGATLSHTSTNTVFIHWTAAFSRDTTICGYPSSSSTRISETQPPSGNVIFASFVDLSRLIFQDSFWYLVCISVQNA